MIDSNVAFIITLCFGICTFIWGRKAAIAPVTESLLKVLEEQHFIKMRINKDGVKEIVSLDEVN
tara:strand:+ start:7114 stop:7305 length:192 start_codon:yes stop_codon:yes gene_type:complete